MAKHKLSTRNKQPTPKAKSTLGGAIATGRRHAKKSVKAMNTFRRPVFPLAVLITAPAVYAALLVARCVLFWDEGRPLSTEQKKLHRLRMITSHKLLRKRIEAAWREQLS
jgi:hypothetical protein